MNDILFTEAMSAYLEKQWIKKNECAGNIDVSASVEWSPQIDDEGEENEEG